MKGSNKLLVLYLDKIVVGLVVLAALYFSVMSLIQWFGVPPQARKGKIAREDAEKIDPQPPAPVEYQIKEDFKDYREWRASTEQLDEKEEPFFLKDDIDLYAPRRKYEEALAQYNALSADQKRKEAMVEWSDPATKEKWMVPILPGLDKSFWIKLKGGFIGTPLEFKVDEQSVSEVQVVWKNPTDRTQDVTLQYSEIQKRVQGKDGKYGEFEYVTQADGNPLQILPGTVGGGSVPSARPPGRAGRGGTRGGGGFEMPTTTRPPGSAGGFVIPNSGSTSTDTASETEEDKKKKKRDNVLWIIERFNGEAAVKNLLAGKGTDAQKTEFASQLRFKKLTKEELVAEMEAIKKEEAEELIKSSKPEELVYKFKDTNLDANSKYQYRVRVMGIVTFSSNIVTGLWSDPVEATTTNDMVITFQRFISPNGAAPPRAQIKLSKQYQPKWKTEKHFQFYTQWVVPTDPKRDVVGGLKKIKILDENGDEVLIQTKKPYEVVPKGHPGAPDPYKPDRKHNFFREQVDFTTEWIASHFIQKEIKTTKRVRERQENGTIQEVDRETIQYQVILILKSKDDEKKTKEIKYERLSKKPYLPDGRWPKE